jgi:hypothetical protein
MVEERIMTDERREGERYPFFRRVGLIARDSGGNETEYAIMLRDASDRGLGGVYIGQDPIDNGRDFFLKEADDGVKKIRIVWTRRVAEYVSMLGFEIITE